MKKKSSNSSGNFMSTKDESVCLNVSKGDAPYSQRAMAILALNDGNTRAEAAHVSGLSIGQVGYWIARYRTMGMEIFPKTLIGAGASDPVVKIEASKPDRAAGMKNSKEAKKSKSKKPKKQKKAKKSKKGEKNKGKKSKSKAVSKAKAKKSKSSAKKGKNPAKRSTKGSKGKSNKKPAKKSSKKSKKK